MLTKILITLLVIIGASFYLRKGRNVTKTEQAIRSQGRFGGSQNPFFNRILVYGLIAVSMLATASYWGWNWYDENQVVTVQISSPMEAMSAVYQVRKKDIQARKITTIDGIEIRLSNQERVTISTGQANNNQ